MSIWKSPVFYFGILLVLVVAAALIAPFVVSWDRYKPELQAYGQKLTGRDVVIAGPVQVRLFPWPRLEAQDVRIANAKEFGAGDFLSTDKVTVRLSLAGLFNGSLDVEAVDLEAPQLVIIRNKAGETNWRMTPAQAISKSGVLNRVKLDQILVHNGSIWMQDEGRNYSGALSKIEAKLAAGAIEGPWKLNGQGTFRGQVLDLSVSTGVYAANTPLKLFARAIPADQVIPMIATEGEWSGTEFKGTLRIDPHDVPDQKQSAEGDFQPLKLQADLRATIDSIALDKIKINPADTKDSGTLIEGSGNVELQSPAHAQLALTSPRVNLDTLLGAGSLSKWRDGGVLAVANGIFQAMPSGLSTDVDVSVNVLTSGGDTLNNVAFKGLVDQQTIRINEASAALPGRSSANFDGVIFPGEGAAELGGKLLFETSDFRAFLGWIAPERKAAIDSAWTGSRGRLVLKSDMDWTQSRFGMQNLQYEFDAAPGTGELALRLGEVPGVDLKLKASRVNLDDLIPQGFSLLPNGKALSFSEILRPLFKGQDRAERHMNLQVDALTINEVSANDVTLDFTTGLSGVEVKALRVGDVDGATLTGNGLMLSSPDGPSGSMKFALAAADPTAFLRLLGLVGQDKPPAWTTALGKTDMKFDITASHDGKAASLVATANGTSGPLGFAGTGELTGITALETAHFTANGVANSDDGSNILRLMGLVPLQNDSAAGEATLALQGDWQSGLLAEFKASALEAEMSYKGKLQPLQTHWGPDGDISISARSAAGLRRIMGWPLKETEGTINMAAHIADDSTGLHVTGVKANILGTSLTGTGTIDGTGKLSADLETGPLELGDVLTWSLLDWDGSANDVTKSFADPKAALRPAEIFVHPQSLVTGIGVPMDEAIIGYGATADAVTLSLRQPGPEGQEGELVLKPLGASYDVSAHGRIKLDVAKILKGTDGAGFGSGTLQLEGSARGEGRSPAAVLASLNGKGSYWLNAGKLDRITLNGYATGIAATSSQDSLSQTLKALDNAPGTEVGERTGAFTLQNGALALAPFGPAATDSVATIAAGSDLTEGTVQVATRIDIPARSDLPPVTITYAGPPGSMQKRSGTAALAAKLGYQLLAKDMAALEALQQQQAALAAQEEVQRKQDEERFAAYQEQREELRKRLRERRVFAAERAAQAADLQASLAAALQTGDAMNKSDLARQLRIRAARAQILANP